MAIDYPSRCRSVKFFVIIKAERFDPVSLLFLFMPLFIITSRNTFFLIVFLILQRRT